MSYHFLLDLALIILSTKVLGLVTQRFQMPQVVGALLAGLLLGPAGLNILKETAFLSQLSEIGVIVLMFSAGMGTDIHELRNSGKAGFLVALLGVLVPLVMGTALAWGAIHLGVLTGGSFLEAVFVGTILTATSVSITVETLKEMEKLDTKVGNTILAAALIDDVLGLIALTIVSGVAGGKESILLVLLKIVLFFLFAGVGGYGAYRVFCKIIERRHGENYRRYPVLAFVLCLVMAYCAEEFFSVADITGAYAAGLVISCTPKATYIQSKYEPLGYLLLTPIFFAGIGINVQMTAMSRGMVAFSVLLLVISVISKVLGCGLGAKLCKFGNKESLQVGVGMVCRGEVALIVANRGLSMGVLSQELMTPVIITVVGGTILTPILLKLAFRGQEKNEMAAGNLTDRYEKVQQLDIVSQELLQQDHDLMENKEQAPEKAEK
ncbi:cation:proton antiporter [Oscillibacter sp.]|uniref:cation:proton antiporter n=1 Tax=Oscillibacter sp. TaxID=1945593 RepID=UPI0026327D76|nr:cation:proton antiporter [Oscillibacter sp.]MDD3346904.1 cation:proton antiporter [Oscillibacter sp.]